jgi:annexin A7/11
MPQPPPTVPTPGGQGAPPTTQGASNAPPPFPSNDATVNVQGPQAQAPYFPPPPMPMVHAEPLWYLGTPIVDPHAPPAPHGIVKVPGYDPAVDYEKIQKATAGRGDEAKCTFSFLVPSYPRTE